MTNPLQPNHADPSPTRAPWVDNHLILNSMAVVRHRIQTAHPGALGAIDAVSGYFANGHYLQANAHSARLDYWLDWFECSLELLMLMRKLADVALVSADLDDCDDAFDLRALCDFSVQLLERLSGQSAVSLREVSVQFNGTEMLLQLSGNLPPSLFQDCKLPAAVTPHAVHPASFVVRLR